MATYNDLLRSPLHYKMLSVISFYCVVDMSALSISGVLCAFVVVLSMYLLYVSLGLRDILDLCLWEVWCSLFVVQVVCCMLFCLD